jgi:hypothetical protein
VNPVTDIVRIFGWRIDDVDPHHQLAMLLGREGDICG